MNLEIESLDAPLGALVYGWQPNKDLSAADKITIQQSLQKHQVLVLRGHQQPTDEQLVRFARHFGNLIKGSEWFGDLGAQPEILRVNNLVDKNGVPEGTGAATSLEWHSDYSYVPTVGKVSFLEAVEIPRNNPPQTCFCNQYDAFERLSEATKKLLRPLKALHSITGYKSSAIVNPMNGDESSSEEIRDGFKAKQARNRKKGISQPDIPAAEHPVILKHPDTGREILYVSKGITRRILGMPEDESSSLLKELAEHSTRPEYVYAHNWRAGDMVVFDTLGTLHRRDSWNPSERRIMRQLSSLWQPPTDSMVA
ncbi:MAG: TauD/TfdA family dioxygenase [Pseudomonadales bacterium]|nr:TauD/TfdA family dioxygenase [Pseudomonadales bacterium]